MNDQAEYDEVNDLGERYLLHLRGEGPMPDLGHLDQGLRAAVLERFEILDILADRPSGPPPRDQDPVAARLGLVSRNDPSVESVAEEADPVRAVLDELDLEFGPDLGLEWHSPWMLTWHSEDLIPVTQCNVLGVPMAILVCDELAVHGPGVEPIEPVEVGRFLRRYPEISAVTLVTHDASQAIVLNDASCHPAIDPANGWVPAGAYVRPGPFNLELRRFLDSRLPRWEPVENVGELGLINDVEADASAAVEHALASALRTKPRLSHKKVAQASLRVVDLDALSILVAGTQAGAVEPTELADRVLALGREAT